MGESLIADTMSAWSMPDKAMASTKESPCYKISTCLHLLDELVLKYSRLMNLICMNQEALLIAVIRSLMSEHNILS